MKIRAALFLLIASAALSGQRSTGSLSDIQNVIVIYQENWSFDSLYGFFPGANGIAKAGKALKQESKDGKEYSVLPQPVDTRLRPIGPDPRFPADLPVAPFDLSKFVKPDDQTGDIIHRFYQEQLQINEGRMNRFGA